MKVPEPPRFAFVAALVLAVIVAVSCSGCLKDGEARANVSNSQVEAQLLFTYKDCEVVRFFDGNIRYFARCEHSDAAIEHTESCGKNCTRPVSTPTVRVLHRQDAPEGSSCPSPNP